jgi:hypothetical protein
VEQRHAGDAVLIQNIPYRIFVLSQRADRPNEPWTIEDVLGPGPVDVEAKIPEYIKGRPYPLNWSFCHEEWRTVHELGGPKVYVDCKRNYYEPMLDGMATSLAQLGTRLQEYANSILAVRNHK